jgi:hypothetical protein
MIDPEDGGDTFLRNIGLSAVHGITTQTTVVFIIPI